MLFFLLLPRAGSAQTPDPSADPQVTLHLQDVSRFESWSFFEPPPGGADPTYRTFGNRITLGARVSGRRFEIEGAVQYSQLLNLPEDSIGPGALGSGALYYFSAEAPAAFQLYFKTMSLRVKGLPAGLSIAAGRMPFASGEERPSGNADVEALTNRRIGARLIGTFETSMFDRSFDGARLDVDRRAWSANASLLFPTQGGYEESANPTISRLKLLATSATFKPALLPGQQLQGFAYHYRDRRDVQARPDNVLFIPGAVDVSIATIGASHVGVYAVAGGQLDSVLWLAAQTGDWFGQDHRAVSVAVEGGYRLRSRWRPWIRAGHLHASGDEDAADARHGTFFQMIPSVQRYAASETYALMNLRDTFVEVSLDPHTRVSLRAAVHRLSLDDAADRWYYGSGATSRTGGFFGFASRPSRGALELGTALEGFADVALTRSWSLNAYSGVVKGGDVVRQSFSGDRLFYLSIQNVLSF